MKIFKVNIIFILLLIIFGCDTQKGTQNSFEIYSWWTGDEGLPLETIINLYKEKYPDISVINSTVAGGAGFNARTVLYTRIIAGDPPDTFLVHAGHELIDSWVKRGKMEPITYLFDENNNRAAFRKELLDIISYEGDFCISPRKVP